VDMYGEFVADRQVNEENAISRGVTDWREIVAELRHDELVELMNGYTV